MAFSRIFPARPSLLDEGLTATLLARNDWDLAGQLGIRLLPLSEFTVMAGMVMGQENDLSSMRRPAISLLGSPAD